ncbi:30S ribosomal protein S5 [Candidatus Peregrinibacteria bacterium]|nr:30S ribosomal protein S5 [Candidatus Peregrinibacteria bacterium]
MTAKTSRPDRKGDRGRRQKEPSEFAEATLSVDRVTRVVKGGRRMRFRAIVVVGNRKGKVGLGTGKAAEVQAAVRKAASAAKRAMIRIPIVDGTIPHQVETKFKAAKIRLLPAYEGTGIIAGGALRVILDHAGVRNVLSKRYGTRNKLVNAQTTMQALGMLRFGKESKQAPAPEVAVVEASPDALLPFTEMTRTEAEQKVQEARRLGMEEN